MAVCKHSIPILEYDTDPAGLIRHDRPGPQYPRRAVFAFLGDLTDRYAQDVNGEVLDVFETITRNTNIYKITYQGEDLCLCRAPLGGSAAVQLLDHLIGRGVREIIAVGSCGALAALPENAFLVPVTALRDEGASYHYLPPERYVQTSPLVCGIIGDVLKSQDFPYAKCMTWTTDGFFRETKEMVAYRREEGCLTVEMECASLAACAKRRGVEFGQLLYTADSLANAAKYEERGWGRESMMPALMLCLEIAARLP